MQGNHIVIGLDLQRILLGEGHDKLAESSSPQVLDLRPNLGHNGSHILSNRFIKRKTCVHGHMHHMIRKATLHSDSWEQNRHYSHRY